MNVFMTGGTGFIGRYLARKLTDHGFSVTIATRSPEHHQNSNSDKPATNPGDQVSGGPLHNAPRIRYVPLADDLTASVDGCDVVVNLAGESLFGKRWTSSVKKRLYDSRIGTTRDLVTAIGNADSKPALFLSASAVGYYGDRGEERITEDMGSGSDFLATICRDWENESLKASDLGVRVANPRIGIALGRGGGALGPMLPVFQAFLGGSLGPGSQFFPWIHIEDLCRSFLHVIRNESMEGPYNATGPEPVTMDAFTSELGRVLSRPSLFKVPQFALNVALGEAATMLTTSLRAVPAKLEQDGFSFEYADAGRALESLLTDKETE
ncbi:TIGR01777 family oxidoreductase [Balneolales bacterium ANBcel1]|nr:TIGR01777 family oxidoreductase [Balneolales bacterium ANBcel1]